MDENFDKLQQRAAAMTEEQAERLIRQFEEHFHEVGEHYPELKNRKSEVFEGWAIQKIAGLQKCVEYLGENLFALETKLNGLISVSQN
jgi:hypothetical protein